jgi:methyl-accepting chemotaxis protein
VTQKAFAENVEIADKIGCLVDEIAAVSQEQANGIDQISKAVSELDRVTQQNASISEESAAAANQMSTRSVNAQEAVNELVEIVCGKKSDRSTSVSTVMKGATKKPTLNLNAPASDRFPEYSLSPSKGNQKSKKSSGRNHATIVNPEDIIPFDEGNSEAFAQNQS